MEASQILHRCIFSALLFFAILWLCLVFLLYSALKAQWKFPLLIISCILTCVCDIVLFVLNELQLRKEGSEQVQLAIGILLRCSSACMISYQSALLWYCSRKVEKLRWFWLIHICTLLPSLLEMVIFIWCALHLRNFSTSFRTFFATSSVEYAALGIGWIRLLSFSRITRLLCIGGFAHLTVAMFSVGLLVAGLEREGLQALFIEVFVLSTIFLLCLAQSVQKLTNKAGVLTEDCTAESDGQRSLHNLHKNPQYTPPSRKTEPDSPIWDPEIIKIYESSSGGRQTSLPTSEAPSIPSMPLMPSIPSLAIISHVVESRGRISVDSKESEMDDLPIDQLWLDIKRQRAAKEQEAITAGRRIQREIRAGR